MTTAQTGSISQDQGVWRMPGKDGCYYLWRNAHGLACSCPSFRRGRKCRHVVRLVAHLTEALEGMRQHSEGVDEVAGRRDRASDQPGTTSVPTPGGKEPER